MLKFSVPSYIRHKNLYLFFSELKKNVPDIFYPEREIDSVYDFPGLPWNGGREISSGVLSLNYLDQIVNNNIYPLFEAGYKIRHTCTNNSLTEKNLKCFPCNYFLNKTKDLKNSSIILASPILKEYLKEYFSEYNFINSTTLGITNIEQYNLLSEKEITVLNYNFNLNIDYLKQLKYPQNIEILCAEACQPNCPQRQKHYTQISEKNLFLEQDHYYCQYAGIHNFYLNLKVLPHTMTNQSINELYKMGFENFKIAGRTLGGESLLEILLYYLIKPEFHDLTRCEVLGKGILS